MNEKEQLIGEIEQASDFLVKEVLDFLLFTKNRTKYLKPSSDKPALKDTPSANGMASLRYLETQLREMAEDREIQAEIKAINQEFLVTEMDGLN
ncbi:MAG: hypothetical protein QNJ72_24670 [Pleurocapsa sp. MO_226.B13]|nr:hypothetical protein [Pleurocapsa sp. MO_226.B13]